MNRFLGTICRTLLREGELAEALRANEAMEVLLGFGHSFGLTTPGRRFALSGKGRYMLVTPLTKEGDVICIYEGLPEPFLLRLGDDDGWQLVGAC